MKKILAVIFLAVCLCLPCFAGCALTESGMAEQGLSVPAGSGVLVSEEETSSGRAKLSAQALTASDGSEMQLLTVVVEPSYATNRNIVWSMYWENGESAWASGKDVNDYVELLPTSEGAQTATVRDLQPFGEPVIVKATAEDSVGKESEVYDTCRLDYAARMTGLGVKFFGGTEAYTMISAYTDTYLIKDNSYGFLTSIEAEPVYTAHTVEDEFTYRYTVQYTAQHAGVMSTATSGELALSSNATMEQNIPFDAEYPTMGGLNMAFGCNPFNCPYFEGNGATAYTYFHSNRGKIVGPYQVYVGRPIATIRIYATGTYSSFVREIGIGYDPSALVIETTSAALDVPSVVL